MKKLYGVTIECYVLAESREEAESIAADRCEEQDARAYLADSVDQSWWNAYPYGNDGRTCGQIVTECPK